MSKLKKQARAKRIAHIVQEVEAAAAEKKKGTMFSFRISEQMLGAFRLHCGQRRMAKVILHLMQEALDETP